MKPKAHKLETRALPVIFKHEKSLIYPITRMLKRLFMSIENRMIGKMRWQGLFQMLHRIGIRGLNYYNGHTVETSGEVWTMHYVFEKLKAANVQRPMVFDVGANTGQYLDVLLAECGEEIDCHTFEPAEATFLPLEEHFKSKSFIHPVQIGLGKENGSIDLFSNHDSSTIASLYPIYNLEQRTTLVRKESITIRTMDDYCAENGIERVDFLKIDVEGAELDVLLGAEKMLRDGKIRFVQFEFGPNNITSKTYMKDFFQVLKGFQIYRILRDGIRPLPAYNEELEIPLVSNFLAERIG
jgi:FkbM family methyltransferase